MASPLILIGFMGAGKTSLGRRLAAHRGVAHFDSDDLVAEKLGRPVEQIFESEGEAAFRAAEQEVVLEALSKSGDAVISLGGGAPLQPQIGAALAAHSVVLLDVDVETAWTRVQGSHRPLAQDAAQFAELHRTRLAAYEALADAAVPSCHADVLVEADAALRALQSAPDGVRLAWATTVNSGYPAFVGPGALAVAPPGLGGRRIVVTDENVGELHAASAREFAGLIEIPAGEEHKTLATTERVWQAMVEQSVTRTDHLFALGGGVVGDLAGFAAACFQRGIAIVQAPTSVVSQVDSAYGGKTGVDLPQAKNYVGAYHQPACVLADTTTLATLPPEEHAAGYAEVLKTALIAGGQLWDWIAAGDAVDERIIFGCARTKLGIVAVDERDGGRRQVLNLGHTIGHALETTLGYGTLRHGDAVGLGLLCALRLSGQDALRDQVHALLEAHQLPTGLDSDAVDVDAVLSAVGRDKKRIGEQPTPFVLVSAPGDVRYGCAVDGDEIEGAVRELLR